MSESPTYDEFLADPTGAWRTTKGEIRHDWAVQAARGSLDFRLALREEVLACLGESGSFEGAAKACAIVAEISDKHDVAELFRAFSGVRSPADWAAEFARRFAK